MGQRDARHGPRPHQHGPRPDEPHRQSRPRPSAPRASCRNACCCWRKLALVVDLDQTIIHACIDPTVGGVAKTSTNPNYESVKNVKAFQLNDGPRGVAHQCWYYIKMRPRLEEFLQRIATMYELHVYTMGTRAYAESVARIVDPERKLFGNRVISRDENGNMSAKSLQRLFLVSTNMVVIIDDRADVGPGTEQPHQGVAL